MPKGSFREIASASGMSTSTLYRLTTGEVAIDDGRVGAKPILIVTSGRGRHD